MEDKLQHKIKEYYQLAYYHLKLAHIMHNHSQFKPAFLLCNWALTSMIRALYIYENKENSSLEINLIELLHLLHTDHNPGLDIVVFVGEMNYLVNEGELDFEAIKPGELDRLLRKTEEVLNQLSRRIISLL